MHVIPDDGPDDAAPDAVPGWARRMSAPENELPRGVGSTEVLVATDDVAVAVTGVEAYSTGFTFSLAVRLRRPRPDLASGVFAPYPYAGNAHAGSILLLGLEYPDGRRGSTLDDPGDAARGPDGDEALILVHGGGHSDDLRADERFWVSPVPPAGPVTVVVSWPAFDVAEARVELDGAAIRAAAAQSRTLWPPQPPPVRPAVAPPVRPASGWFARPPS